MTIASSAPIAKRLAGMAADIHQLVPGAEVRLFGSRARVEARPDSDIDLLITAPDDWLATRDRFTLLADLWGAVAQPDLLRICIEESFGKIARFAPTQTHFEPQATPQPQAGTDVTPASGATAVRKPRWWRRRA